MSSSDRPLVWGLLGLVAIFVVGLIVGGVYGLPADISTAVIALAGTAMGGVTTWLTRRTTAEAPATVAATVDAIVPDPAAAPIPMPSAAAEPATWTPPTKTGPNLRTPPSTPVPPPSA